MVGKVGQHRVGQLQQARLKSQEQDQLQRLVSGPYAASSRTHIVETLYEAPARVLSGTGPVISRHLHSVSST